ncbi:MAG: hypothetical protein IJX86_07350 [Lachnospiraceae bacterium]|nr:hypothetical protein [Lachnospiraceae bacterium]
MMFGIFATLGLFFLWIKFVIGRNSRKAEQNHANYWERERKANEVRKQPLDNLAFLEIPFDLLPFGVLTDSDTQNDEAFIRTFTDKKVLNLTGVSNTDLKLKYGAANLPLLSQYDQNYTLLVRTLNTWAERLFKENYKNQAGVILEYLVQTGADTSITYLLLTKVYLDRKDYESVERLRLLVAESSFTLKNSILREMNLLIS